MQNKKIILIMTDTQRWDMVNCYRDTGLQTPNIDAIAAEGMRFERAYTTQPVCQPARAGIFTGQHPSVVGSWANSMGMSDNAYTLGQRLSANGIHSAYIGKWHLDGGDYFGTGRCPAGWDEKYWYDMRRYLDELTEEERLLSRVTANMLTTHFSEEFTYGHRCSNRAIDFVKNHGQEDFFLALSYDEPHGPSICPPEYFDLYKDFEFPKDPDVCDMLEGKPDYQRVWGAKNMTVKCEDVHLKARNLFGCNSFVDYEIGRVTAAIEEYCPSAVVIYTSDHGHAMHSHCLDGKGAAVYDSITRIPLIIKGRDIPKGVVNPHPISHINLAPTVMELMGLEPSKTFAGKSLTGELTAEPQRVNDYVFIEFGRFEIDHDSNGGFQPLRAVFDGRFKLSVNLLSTDELYDLQNDPYELVNLIEDERYAAERNRLHDAVIENMNANRDPFRGYYWERRPWRKDAAPATWRGLGMTRQRDEELEPKQLDYNTGLPMKEATREQRPPWAKKEE